MSTVLSCLRHLDGAGLSLMAALLRIPAPIFWLYFSGTVILIIGLAKIPKEAARERGLARIVPFGRLFFALPMAVFGTEHLTNTADIASIVPRWIPAHRFWVYLVGVALICAALSLVTRVQARLAAALLGATLLLFVVLIHIPNIVANPHNRFVWAVGLRDLAFSGGALAFAGSFWSGGAAKRLPGLVNLGRFFVAVPALFFGVEHFLHAEFAPGVPLQKLTPEWIPGRLFWGYLAGTVLLAAGTCLLANKKARLAATCLGLTIFVVVMFVYLLILVASPVDLVAINYFADTLLFSGAALLLAEGLTVSG